MWKLLSNPTNKSKRKGPTKPDLASKASVDATDSQAESMMHQTYYRLLAAGRALGMTQLSAVAAARVAESRTNTSIVRVRSALRCFLGFGETIRPKFLALAVMYDLPCIIRN